MSQAMKQQGVESTAKTVAQFLSESKRFNGYTMEYTLSDVDAKMFHSLLSLMKVPC